MTEITAVEAATINQRRAADPGVSAWVSASAGTGKTKVLTDRVLSLLVAGSAPEKLLCLTFTRAAAAEMENRIANRLGAWTMMADKGLRKQLALLLGYKPDKVQMQTARQLFARVLDTPGGMNIQTIHAFCQSVLRRFPLEADLTPHFKLMDERDSDELLHQARETVLAHIQTGAESPLAMAIGEVTQHLHESKFPEILATLTRERGRLARLIDEADGIGNLVSRVFHRLGVSPEETEDTIFAEAGNPANADEIGLRTAIEVLLTGAKTDIRRGELITAWLTPQGDSAIPFDDYADAYLTAARNESDLQIRKSLMTKKLTEDNPAVVSILAVEAERVHAAYLRARAATTAHATAGLLRLGDALLAAYRRQKERRALIDYDDLILETARLLQKPGIAPWVLYKLDGGIDHILIDEAQDTSPEQWRVVEALAEEFFAGEDAHDNRRTIFAVGDLKQSIYSFQGADPQSFREMREHFAKTIPAARDRWREVDLNVSFRSAPKVLSAVDLIFAQDGAKDGLSFDDDVMEHIPKRAGEASLVELWPPVDVREIDATIPWKPPVERIQGDSTANRLAQLIAKRIKCMIDDKELLESKNRPIQPGDIMILVRRRGPIVEEIVRALKNREIGVAGVDRMVLTDQMAVMDLIALGRVLLLPEDDLTLATVLKGPIAGLTEDDLFELAYDRPGALWQALSDKRDASQRLAAAFDLLSGLRRQADTMPPFELYSHILGALGGREKLLHRLGPDALDPISEFLDLAISYEDSHTPTLEGFLYWLESGETEVKRDLEQARSDAVRVMTVHGAKGLEAPIVFLPDTMQVPRAGFTLLWPKDDTGGELMLWPPRRGAYETVAETERTRITQERDREYRRLLYVALTRAEDRLYICGWANKTAAPEGCWYNLVKRGLGGNAEEVEDPFLAEADETDGATILRLTSPQLDEVEDFETQDIEPRAPLPAWADTPPPDEPAPPVPLAPSRPTEEEPAVQSPLSGDDGYRFKRGNIIHALLQTLPDLPPGEREEAAKSYLARAAHELDPETQAAITEETLAVLHHPDHARVFGPESRAEVPIVGHLNGQVISGQIDRLAVTPEAIEIIDYKTNRPPPARPEDVSVLYLGQMGAYREALTAIYPDRPIRCYLLWTDGPHLMELDGALLTPPAA